MDLYEALKNGTKAEDLVDSFYKDLAAANARITAEKQKEAKAKAEEDALKKAYISECRECVIDSFIDYIYAVCDDDDIVKKFDYEVLEKAFIEFEKEVQESLDIIKALERRFSQKEKEKKSEEIPF